MNLMDNKADWAVRQRAYKLAESGRYEAVRDIERALIGEGWPNAGRVMHSDYVMQAVAERCRVARAKRIDSAALGPIASAPPEHRKGHARRHPRQAHR